MKEETLRKGSGILGNIMMIKNQIEEFAKTSSLRSRTKKVYIHVVHEFESGQERNDEINLRFNTLNKFEAESRMNISEIAKERIEFFTEQYVESLRIVFEKELRDKQSELAKLKDE